MKTQLLALSCFLFFLSCTKNDKKASEAHIKEVTTAIDDEKLKDQATEQGDWLTYGLNYSEDRYSPLTQINMDNVKNLGLVWSLDLGTKRGLEATPLVVDGIMYFSGDWSKVMAVDARQGKLLWEYDPHVPREYGEKLCCDAVNRGVAIYKGKVFVGTLDGRLIALDAVTGKEKWSKLTVDRKWPYSITGAPRVVEGKVLIGNGGAEYGVRGYITAYEVETGEQAWRFYTVPGDPSKPFEHKDLEAAAKTWGGEWWKYGGGGTVWDAMAYDPELGLLYIGTGNGSPWDRNFRSPGGGDNLYLSSIVALKASTGEYVWHYQTTPGEQWDFTATQHIILADLTIKGEKRKLLMQAPKNGFFYVLDRTNGKFISGDAFVYVNWAKGIDSLTGRPIENDFARYEKVNTDIAPIYSGGHNWQSMAFNHKTGLVYIPARDNVTMYGRDLDWVYNKKGYGTGNGQNFATGFNPKVPTRTDSVARKIAPRGFLLAWDPLKRKEVWRVPQKADWNGGVVTTAANLVFEGDAAGDLKAFDATNGKELWKANLGGGIIAPPITYLMDGKQYVSIAVGWGGAFGLKQKIAPMQGGRIFTFGLDGKAPYPTFEKAKEQKLIDVPFSATKDQIAHGQGLFLQYCDMCHAAAGKGGGGVIPDLGYSSKETHASIMQIVREGAYLPLGMPKFGDRLSEKDVKDIQYFIFNSAKQLRAEKNKK